MFFFIFGLLVGVLGILVASMRSGVKFHVDSSFPNVKRTILDPFREKNIQNVSAPKLENDEPGLAVARMDFSRNGSRIVRLT